MEAKERRWKCAAAKGWGKARAKLAEASGSSRSNIKPAFQLKDLGH